MNLSRPHTLNSDIDVCVLSWDQTTPKDRVSQFENITCRSYIDIHAWSLIDQGFSSQMLILGEYLDDATFCFPSCLLCFLSFAERNHGWAL